MSNKLFTKHLLSHLVSLDYNGCEEKYLGQWVTKTMQPRYEQLVDLGLAEVAATRDREVADTVLVYKKYKRTKKGDQVIEEILGAINSFITKHLPYV